MSTAFVGEVRLVGFNFAPDGWSTCQGQTLAISGNEALFSLIGTTYGGNGQSNFNLPNLCGRVPVHQGNQGSNNYVLGAAGGSENVILAANNLPSHTHTLMASANSTGGVNTPAGNVVGGTVKMFTTIASPLGPTDPMSAAMITLAPGGSMPHNNLQPYLVLNWIISLQGIFPSQ
jgi:microcystin-dependent protein